MKQIVKSIFNGLGLEIKRKTPNHTIKSSSKVVVENMLAGLSRSKQRGLTPFSVIDVGAAQGDWTKMALEFWTEANYVLIEPLQERESVLTSFAASTKNIHIVNAAAGATKGTIPFFVTEDLDGSGIADNGSNAKQRTINITTIDAEVERLSLQGPYLIKLDTHGYEVPILTGTAEILKNTELIIIECYGFRIAPQSLLFWEMCQLMEEKGFRLIDIVDVMRRNRDQAFWQCDAFFISKHSPIFLHNTYH